MIPQSFKRAFQTYRRDQSGTVAIEFVLIAPILIALIFGVVTLGYFMGLSHSVHQLATQAARVSVAGIDTQERRTLAQTYLDQAGARYPLIKQSALTPTLSFDEGDTPAITVQVAYDIEGSLLDIANNFLRLNLTDMNRSAYLAY